VLFVCYSFLTSSYTYSFISSTIFFSFLLGFIRCMGGFIVTVSNRLTLNIGQIVDLLIFFSCSLFFSPSTGN
jgi:hypothetical protein